MPADPLRVSLGILEHNSGHVMPCMTGSVASCWYCKLDRRKSEGQAKKFCPTMTTGINRMQTLEVLKLAKEKGRELAS